MALSGLGIAYLPNYIARESLATENWSGFYPAGRWMNIKSGCCQKIKIR
ncbi:hypothetical protein ACP3P6_23340 [Enterobacter mori]